MTDTDASAPIPAPYGSAETRRRILDSARAVFAEKGFVDGTIDDIVVHCEVSRGTFYYYFKNKEDVFETLVRTSVVELRQQTTIRSLSSDPFERIRERNLGYLATFAEYRDIFRNLFQVATIEPRFGALRHELHLSFLTPICRALERDVKVGRIRPLNPRIAAFGLGGMLDWFAYTWLSLDRLEAPEVTLEEAARELSELWFHAIYAGQQHAGCSGLIPIPAPEP